VVISFSPAGYLGESKSRHATNGLHAGENCLGYFVIRSCESRPTLSAKKIDDFRLLIEELLKEIARCAPVDLNFLSAYPSWHVLLDTRQDFVRHWEENFDIIFPIPSSLSPHR
jgi:hypothetical protein